MFIILSVIRSINYYNFWNVFFLQNTLQNSVKETNNPALNSCKKTLTRQFIISIIYHFLKFIWGEGEGVIKLVGKQLYTFDLKYDSFQMPLNCIIQIMLYEFLAGKLSLKFRLFYTKHCSLSPHSCKKPG